MVIFISIVSTLKFCFQLLRNEDIFQKKKNKSKRSSLDTCWRKKLFCSGDVTKTESENRERGTWNGERGTGKR